MNCPVCGKTLVRGLDYEDRQKRCPNTGCPQFDLGDLDFEYWTALDISVAARLSAETERRTAEQLTAQLEGRAGKVIARGWLSDDDVCSDKQRGYCEASQDGVACPNCREVEIREVVKP